MFPDEPEEPQGGPSPMRLLTRYEYDNTIRDLIGVQGDYSRAFPSENLVHGWENRAETHRVSHTMLRSMLETSELIAQDAVRTRRAELLDGCDVGQRGEEVCGREFVRSFVPRAFRRPATEEELRIFLDLFDRARETYGFEAALSLALQAVLQSPQFLYRIELPQEGDEPGQVRKVSSWEMATRLSYFLWASMPDDELFRAAAAGELQSLVQVEAQARRLLADRRAQEVVRHFHRQWLGLDKLRGVVKDTTVYQGYDAQMPEDWRRSVEAFVEHAFLEEGTLEAMLGSQALFLTPQLAELYGFDAADGAPDERSGLSRFRADASERAGLLTQPGMLAKLADPYQSSPIRRGIFVRERILCQLLPPPPNDVIIEPPDPDPSATTRERFRIHTDEERCAGCHLMIDPLGFGFEFYDGMGRYRTQEHGLTVDGSGSLGGLARKEDKPLQGDFADTVELSQRLAGSLEVHDCIATHWFQFALGRAEDDDDLWPARRVRRTFWEADGEFEALLVAIARSDAFRYTKVEGGE